MEGIYSTDQAADYVAGKSGGEISRRAFIWYVRDAQGRAKAAQEGVLQSEKIGNSRVFTKAQLDEFIQKYPKMSVRGRKVGFRPQNKSAL